MLAVLTRHTNRAQRRSRRFANAHEPAIAATPIRGRLGLTIPDVEELLIAVQDRAETVNADRAARLHRGRKALELELARLLDE